MSLTNFEPIKQQILDAIQHDPDIKYIFLGWMTDQFVPKTDYSKLLDEIKDLREDSNRRFDAIQNEMKALREDMQQGFMEHKVEMQALREESNKRWEENAKRWEENTKRWEENTKRWEENTKRWEENTKRWEENTKRWEVSDKHFEAVHQEIKELREDMQQGFQQQTITVKDHIDRRMGEFGRRWGYGAETAFREGLLCLIGEYFHGTIAKWRVYDHECRVRKKPSDVELDIVMSNGKCIVAEIKSSVSQGDVFLFEKTVEFYEQLTGIRPDRKVLITPYISPEALEWIEGTDIEVIPTEQISQ